MERCIVLLGMGLLLCVLGAINWRGNAGTIHWYNRRKVREADLPKYARTMGLGTIIIGVALLVAALLALLLNEQAGDLVGAVGIAAGLAVMLYGQLKYNHGIF